ncbi:MAG TPA: threonine ammonia-lyase IlvA [Acidimicrobiales bacterium]|nr:threonine ammonia-lyase IlvA [Acidimicrobiales bacterium]
MPEPAELTATAVAAAAEVLRPVVRQTPVERSERLSLELGTEVWLKREDLQIGRSYKVRGAYNVISSLTAAERRLGVTCASAGNHAQGVAYSCRALGIRGKVFVPTSTPRQKRARITALGRPWVDLVLAGANYDEASAAALEDAAATGSIYVHPFDDARTIAGQGTVAVELSEQRGEGMGTVIVPVGGGGLIAGIALWLKQHAPGVRIVGAEPAGAASMAAALVAGGPVALDDIDSFVDGAAVGTVGRLTYPLVSDLVDDMVTVPEGAVCTELLELYQSDGIIAEPAAALASAAARRLSGLRGPVVCIVSGGNNDVSRYADIVERSLLFEGLKHYFLVTFPQEPGALRQFLDGVLGPDDDIALFDYVKKSNRETGPALVGIELARAGDVEGLLERMAASPLQIERVPPGSPLFTFLV